MRITQNDVNGKIHSLIILNLQWSGLSQPQEAEDADQELVEEYEEVDHEVEWGVVPEGLVGGPEPADEGGGREQAEVDQGQEEGAAPVASAEQVQQADHHVSEEKGNVSWKYKWWLLVT